MLAGRSRGGRGASSAGLNGASLERSGRTAGASVTNFNRNGGGSVGFLAISGGGGGASSEMNTELGFSTASSDKLNIGAITGAAKFNLESGGGGSDRLFVMLCVSAGLRFSGFVIVSGGFTGRADTERFTSSRLTPGTTLAFTPGCKWNKRTTSRPLCRLCPPSNPVP